MLLTVAACACCSCNAPMSASNFAVRCAGTQSFKAGDVDTPSIDTADTRTYVIDGERNAIYRADPYVVANLCVPDSRCDVEITGSRVTAHISKHKGFGRGASVTETRFELDRDKGDLHPLDTVRTGVDDKLGGPLTTNGTFTCVTVPVPRFQVPEA
jgi:hypothetical protein